MAKRKSKTSKIARRVRQPPRATSPAVEMVKEAWDRIDAWCRVHVPGVLDRLNPGASATEIAALERTIKQPLPADVRKSLAIHNGEPWRASVDFIFGLALRAEASSNTCRSAVVELARIVVAPQRPRV
jgi:hypothetical protein